MTVINEAKPNEVFDPLVRLSFLINDAMGKCRKDFIRQINNFDFCESCPLLMHCQAQEHTNTERHADSLAGKET